MVKILEYDRDTKTFFTLEDSSTELGYVNYGTAIGNLPIEFQREAEMVFTLETLSGIGGYSYIDWKIILDWFFSE